MSQLRIYSVLVLQKKPFLRLRKNFTMKYTLFIESSLRKRKPFSQVNLNNVVNLLKMTFQFEDRPRIKSTWRDPIGKPLTDRLINKRAKEGFYGLAAKQAALNKTENKGFVDRCQCGEWRGIKWLDFSYLPKPGFYCHSCRLIEKSRGEKRKEIEKQFRKKVTQYEEFC